MISTKSMLGSNVVMKPSDPLSIFTNPSSGLHWEVVCEREKVTTKSNKASPISLIHISHIA